jgi:hypothetical protein
MTAPRADRRVRDGTGPGRRMEPRCSRSWGALDAPARTRPRVEDRDAECCHPLRRPSIPWNTGEISIDGVLDPNGSARGSAQPSPPERRPRSRLGSSRVDDKQTSPAGPPRILVSCSRPPVRFAWASSSPRCFHSRSAPTRTRPPRPAASRPRPTRSLPETLRRSRARTRRRVSARRRFPRASHELLGALLPPFHPRPLRHPPAIRIRCPSHREDPRRPLHRPRAAEPRRRRIVISWERRSGRS